MEVNKGGREASGVAHDSPGVGDKEGGREASVWRKTPVRDATEWVGESSHLRVPTPPEWPKIPGGTKPPEGPQQLMLEINSVGIHDHSVESTPQ